MANIKHLATPGLSASKPELLIQAEAVITLLYWLQIVAPEAWSELVVATTRENPTGAVAAWAMKCGLCGPSGPVEWISLIDAETVNSMSNNPSRLGIPEQSFGLYLRTIRKQLATVKGDEFSAMRPLDLPVEIAAKRFVWSPETDPTRGELMDAIVRATEEEVRQQLSAVSPIASDRRYFTESYSDLQLVWFIRCQIVRDSFSEISRTANKFLEDVSIGHISPLDHSTVARGVRHVAEVLGVVLHPADPGGRPRGRTESDHVRHRVRRENP